jgi:hypothetical protein
MRINRTMALVGGGLLAAWLASAASYRNPPPIAEPAPALSVTRTPSEVETEAARLRELLTPRPALTPAGRNPFRFAAPPGEPPFVPRVTTADMPPAVTLPPPAPVKLVGIAESSATGGGEPQRTAILTVDGRLFLAGEGDALETRYRVERVGAEAAELTDLATDSRFTVALDH